MRFSKFLRSRAVVLKHSNYRKYFALLPAYSIRRTQVGYITHNAYESTDIVKQKTVWFRSTLKTKENLNSPLEKRTNKSTEKTKNFNPEKSTGTSSNQKENLPSSIHTSEIDELISDGSISLPTSQIEFQFSSSENSIKSKPKSVPAPSCGHVHDAITKNELPRAVTQYSPQLSLTVKNEFRNVVDCGETSQKDVWSEPEKSAAEILKSVATSFLTSEDEMKPPEDISCYSKHASWPYS